ncbi:MAG: hypothetical protein IPJ74_05035 [Saprospiraceae bacterium]|nr:hypothetical protein [Saprospiraceae bacterium]
MKIKRYAKLAAGTLAQPSGKELNRLDQFIFFFIFNENERLTALYSYIRSFCTPFFIILTLGGAASASFSQLEIRSRFIT